MPTSLLGRDEMPTFNVLGLLLGGRGYASNYFAQRDALKMQEAQRADRDQFQQGLLASPALAAANARPQDRGAQWGLWGEMYKGPESAAALGNNLVTNSLSSIYSRENASYEDELARARMRLSSDEQLRVDQITRDRDAQAKKAAMDGLFAPGPNGVNGLQQQLIRDNAAKAAGMTIPDGYNLVPYKDSLALRPAPGTEDYRKMVGEVQSTQNVLSGLQSLSQMADLGTDSKGSWTAERSALLLEIKRAENLGSLDQGTMDFMADMLPNRMDDYSVNPANWGIVQDKLKVQMARYGGKLDQIQSKWMIPPDMVPNQARGAAPVPGRDIPMPPAKSPLTVRNALTRQREAIGEGAGKEMGKIGGGLLSRQRGGGGGGY